MKKGFTLVETMITIFILTLGIVATSTVTQRNLKGAYYARDQITAYFLAEEAVEMARNIRDTNVLKGGDWLLLNDSIPAPAVNGEPVDNLCIDMHINGPDHNLPFFNDECGDDRLSLHPQDGYHYHVLSNNWALSRYRRSIKLTRPAENEVGMEVTVTWGTALAGEKSFTIYKSLFKP